jgi:hypothetical protein
MADLSRGEDTKRNLKHAEDRAANLADATRQDNPTNNASQVQSTSQHTRGHYTNQHKSCVNVPRIERLFQLDE